jgi:2-succinyl-5-enolpyruvyl-6-hydroxy-3-cyclohexene-1-carboxylate synthase
VHLNLPFREPLVGVAGELPPAIADSRADWLLRGEGSVEIPDGLPKPRTLIVAGGDLGDPREVLAFAAAAGWPVLADPRSGCRRDHPNVVAAFDALLRHGGFASAHVPDVVIRLGTPPASRVLSTWLASTGARQIAVARHGVVVDPEHTAAVFVDAAPDDWCRLVCFEQVGDPVWTAEWAEAERSAQRAIDAALARHAEPTEPAVARALVEQLSSDTTLVVGSSMPVRDVEWFGRPRDGLRVVSNRGANGIDGVVSTAVGVALTGAPTAVLVGDVSVLHDTNALLGLAARHLDLTVVVVDNRGGGIFSFLPQATAVPPERFELLFGTPHEVDLPSLAAVHGLPAIEVHAADGLAPAVRAAQQAPGTHVVVVRTDRRANVAVHDELNAAVAAALSGD